MRGREIERGAIAGGEQRILVRSAALPHRADRVDDVLRRQPVAARDLRRAGLAAAERAAFGEQLRPGRAMDRAVDAAAAEQRAVRGVHDRVDGERRDVGDEDVAGGGADGEGEEGSGHARSLSLVPRSGETGVSAVCERERGSRAQRSTWVLASAVHRCAPPRVRGQGLRPLRLRLRAPRSTVLRTPMSSKCSVRKFRAARRPPLCSISKKSKSELSFEPAVSFLNVESSAMRCTLMRRYSPSAGAVRQAALVDQAGDEIDRAEFGEQRGVEGDFVDAVHDLGLACAASRCARPD